VQKKYLIVIIFIGLLIAYFGWLGEIGLRAEEPRRALVSIEMMENGDYILPHMFGWVYYNKPPLFNWIMILFFKIFGSINEYIVRLPSVVAMFVLAFINWKFVNRYINQEVALLSSLFLLTSADILFYGSVNAGEIDLFYTLVVYIQLMVIFINLKKENYLKLFLLSYFFTGIGFLTKGLPSIAFQGLTLLAVFIYYRKFKLLFNWRHFLGLAVLVFIAGGYIYLLYLKGEHSGFLVRQVKEASQRTVVESSFWDSISGVLITPVEMVRMLLPWSLFLVLFFVRKIKKEIRAQNLVVFSLIFIVVNIPLYWITGDFKERYIYPFIPSACIVLAWLLYENVDRSPKIKNILEILFGIIVTLFPLILIATFFIPEASQSPTRYITTVVLIVASLPVVYFFWKQQQFRIYHFVLLMIMARIAMNTIYLEAYEKTSRATYYKNQVSEILKITGDDPLYMSGFPHTYYSSIDIGSKTYLNQIVNTAPIISFQVPYYITLQTGEVLIFTRDMQPDNYYLIMEKQIRQEVEILYRFDDKMTSHRWCLVRIPEGE